MGSPARKTVFHTRFRSEAVKKRAAEEKAHPGCKATISGEQGTWKVRRNLTAEELSQRIS